MEFEITGEMKRSERERECVFLGFLFFFLKGEREEEGTVGLVGFGMNFWKTKSKIDWILKKIKKSKIDICL